MHSRFSYRSALRAADATSTMAVVEDAEEPDDDDAKCNVFVDREGNYIETMCCDYGFRTGVGRVYSDAAGKIPRNAWRLAVDNYKQEYRALRRSFRDDEYAGITMKSPPRGPLAKVGTWLGSAVVRSFAAIDTYLERNQLLSRLKLTEDEDGDERKQLTTECKEIRAKLLQLTLSNQAVWDRERAREAAGGGVDTPWFVRGVYLALCVFLDGFYNNRPIQRFWFLESVARMPYFCYISMLHLYETLGWWRAGAELRKIHFAEEWNELHHLQIMESLGGDQLWVDRFMAQHASIFYFWVLLLLFIVNPDLAYNFSELIEAHAVDTYGQFADENEALLKSLPPPMVAAAYYRSGDVYMFDEFQTARKSEPRRPRCNNLHDVFIAIRDDEGEHVKTMKACQDETIVEDLKEKADIKLNPEKGKAVAR